MATHETGELVEQDRDGAQLDTHHEHHEEHEQHELEHSDKSDRRHAPNTTPRIDEETAPEPETEPARPKKKFELQDQTNLLPVKQIMLIFLGLNCALFCSLLDQTM